VILSPEQKSGAGNHAACWYLAVTLAASVCWPSTC
jgi:hypothetical protein